MQSPFTGSIDQAVLTEKIDQYKGYFHTAARRFSVPVHADEEHLVQACCLLVAELMESYPTLNPLSDDFDNLLKHAVYNRVINEVRPYLTERRDYHREVSGDLSVSSEDGDGARLFDLLDPTEVSGGSDFWWNAPAVDPAQELTLNELCHRLEFLLTPEAFQLWQLLRFDPPELWESLDEYNELYFLCPDGKYRQRPAKDYSPTYAVMAHHLQWPIRKLRWHLGVIREAALTVFGEGMVERVLHLGVLRDAEGYITLGDMPEVDTTQELVASDKTVWRDELEYFGRKDVIDIGDLTLFLQGRKGEGSYVIKVEWIDYTYGEARGVNGILYRW